MGLVKRILQRTSHKLMKKLNPNRLVLNGDKSVHHGTMAGIIDGGCLATANCPITTKRQQSKSRSKSKSKTYKYLERHTGQYGIMGSHQVIPEALLMAAKNSLPPVQFHHVHGPNAQLSRNKFVARRTQSFCQALVFSNRVILPNERVYIKILEIAKGWSGTIRFGFTSVDPATLRYTMPKHACPDMTNAGHTWARALADEVVRRNSVIHFSYNTNGYIHYGINNQDCGIFYANVKTSQNLWFIVDVYGLTAAIELIDPRIHNAASELDFSRLDNELRIGAALNNNNNNYQHTSAVQTRRLMLQQQQQQQQQQHQQHQQYQQLQLQQSSKPNHYTTFRQIATKSKQRAHETDQCRSDNRQKFTNITQLANNLSPTSTLKSSKSSSNTTNMKILNKSHQLMKATPKVLSPSTRDNNNNNNTNNNDNSQSPTRDCPICCERPINCVLYQCGHMCTCYDCGVKQWRTQSRTCPICRTVIKDVIKTYMS